MLPNVTATSILFFALQLCSKVAVMMNFSSGYKNLMHACDTVRLKFVYTSRAFLETASLEEVVQGMEKKGIKVIYLEDLKASVSLFDKINGAFRSLFSYVFKSKAKPEDASVILFTSGSESVPKAVVLSHENIISNIHQSSVVVDFNSKDVVFNALPFISFFWSFYGNDFTNAFWAFCILVSDSIALSSYSPDLL